MIAYVAVLTTPFFQVTGADGRVSLGGLPPGHYTVTVWHPLIKGTPDQVAQSVDAAGSGVKELTFSLDLKPDFRARRAPGLTTGGYR
jgi:hypothetical protein